MNDSRKGEKGEHIESQTLTPEWISSDITFVEQEPAQQWLETCKQSGIVESRAARKHWSENIKDRKTVKRMKWYTRSEKN